MSDVPPGIRAVPATEAAARLDDPNAIVLDVRTPAEYAQARLPGAINIDFYGPTLQAELSELDTDAPVLLYCRSGSRSGHLHPLLADLGFRDVVDVDGGIIAWANAELPLTNG
ncbi:MAG: rhodanese-like domain-containing protein [Nitriliruptoraceae bacterium]